MLVEQTQVARCDLTGHRLTCLGSLMGVAEQAEIGAYTRGYLVTIVLGGSRGLVADFFSIGSARTLVDCICF